MLTHPWAGVGVLASSLLGLLVAIRAVRARHGLHPEVSRKVMHVALGLAMLACAMLFDRAWPVVVLAVATMVVLAAMRWVPAAAAHFRGVVGGVSRYSAGDFYFPITAALLFAIARGDSILYGVPVLTLTFADATAALVGVFHGRTKLAEGAEAKSLEGSLAFLLVGWLTIYVPLRLSGYPGDASLLVATIVGLFLTAIEAVSPHGSDNLFVPLGCYVALRALLPLPVPASALSALLLAFALIVSMYPLRVRRRPKTRGSWRSAPQRSAATP